VKAGVGAGENWENCGWPPLRSCDPGAVLGDDSEPVRPGGIGSPDSLGRPRACRTLHRCAQKESVKDWGSFLNHNSSRAIVPARA